MRRPTLAAIAAAAVLLTIGLPALSLHLGSTDSRVLPPGSSARVVDATVGQQFAANVDNPVVALVRAPPGASAQLARYEARLARLPGVAAVLPPTRIAPDLWRIDALASAQPLSTQAQRLIGAKVWTK